MRFDAESGLYRIGTDISGAGTGWEIDDIAYSMFDPKIGASLQRESSHAVNAWFAPLHSSFDLNTELSLE